MGRAAPLGVPLGADLGPSWAPVGAAWAVLAPSWAVLGASWELLGPYLGGFGGLWDCRQRREGQKIMYAKNVRFPMENQRFWHLGAFLGRFFDACWAILEASWTVLRPSWASWSDLLSIRGSWGAVLAASRAPKKHAGLFGRPGPPRGDQGSWAGPPWPCPPGYIYIYIYIYSRAPLGSFFLF